jgi:acyl carrier protein
MLAKTHKMDDDTEAFQTFVWNARVRRVLSDTLGVNAEDLADEISLTDDLAADSLDLMQIVIALEEELAVDIDERRLAAVRTVGDLIASARALTAAGSDLRNPPRSTDAVRRGRHSGLELSREPRELPYRATLRGGEPDATTLFRTGVLTPYSTEAIVDDAIRAGRGSALEIALPTESSDSEIAYVRENFEWLSSRGVRVTIGRDYRPPGWSSTLSPLAVVEDERRRDQGDRKP